MMRVDFAMKTGLWIVFYAMVLYVGTRSMRSKGHPKEIILYVCIVGWCLYLSLAELHNWPLITIATPMNILFAPVGRWIDQLWKVG